VTVRLDPKLKYLAELAARKHRRPLSSFIEWAVEQSLSNVVLEEYEEGPTSVADAERRYNLWDLDEPDRIVRLALHFPDLLTHEEQMLWKLVRENGYVWKGRIEGTPPEWRWHVREKSIIWDRLRQHWAEFCDVARGTREPSQLPKWQKSTQVMDDSDEFSVGEIPF
jgi:hypothetical protein